MDLVRRRTGRQLGRQLAAEAAGVLGDRRALTRSRRVVADETDLHELVVPQSTPGGQVEAPAHHQRDAEVAVALLVGLAHHEAQADRRHHQRRHRLAAVGGEHDVDAELTAVGDDPVELGEPVERAHRHRLHGAEDRAEVLVAVDEHDDPRQRVALVEVHRQRFRLDVEIGQQRSAPVELGGEHDDDTGDRLEVVAGGDGGAVRQVAQRAERSRRAVDDEQRHLVGSGAVDRGPGDRAQRRRLAGAAAAGDEQAAALLEVEHRRVLRLRRRIVEHAEGDVATAAAALADVSRAARW